MNTYKYTAIDGEGRRRTGIIKARDNMSAYDELREQGWIVLSLKKHSGPLFGGHRQGTGGGPAGAKSRFYGQGATLLKAGIPLDEMVELLEGQGNGGEGLGNRLSGGSTLAAAMSSCGQVYSPQEIAMVEAGELGGNLEWAFEALCHHFTRREKLYQGLKMAMVYPLFLVVLSLCSLLFIIVVVVPTIMDMFVDLSLQLPWPTRLLMALAHVPAQYLVGAVAVLLALAAGLLAARRQLSVGRELDRLLLKLPFGGRLWLMKDLGVLLDCLGMLLDSGIVIDRAMASCVALCTNGYLRDRVEIMVKRLARGNSLKKSMENGPYPAVIFNLVAAGELSGELGAMLRQGSEYCMKEVENRLRILETMSEPVIVSVLGIIIGFIVISIVWPMLELMTAYM